GRLAGARGAREQENPALAHNGACMQRHSGVELHDEGSHYLLHEESREITPRQSNHRRAAVARDRVAASRVALNDDVMPGGGGLAETILEHRDDIVGDLMRAA